jgi:hypothetical protein
MAGPSGFQVDTIQFGQEMRDVDGSLTIATADMVHVSMIDNGTVVGAAVLAPADAMVLARAITFSVHKLGAAQVDDTGRPASLMARLFGARS